jgi:hypothetical protein
MPNDLRESPFWPADNPAVTAHIDLLQGIITRLADNSASCKTWCITLVSALLSLAGATHVPAMVAFALVPVVIFGFMDTMYLAQERAYRELYSRLIKAVRSASYAREDFMRHVRPLTWASSAPRSGRGRYFPSILV